MAFRELSKTQWFAEMALAMNNNIAVTVAWIGIAMNFQILIYIAVFLFLVRLPLRLLRGDTRFSGKLEDMVTFEFISFLLQLLAGMALFTFLNWNEVMGLFQEAISQPSFIQRLMESKTSIQAFKYGLWAILWVQTVLSILTSAGATAQVLLYETGQENPEQWH